jgi:hypothetical protein
MSTSRNQRALAAVVTATLGALAVSQASSLMGRPPVLSEPSAREASAAGASWYGSYNSVVKDSEPNSWPGNDAESLVIALEDSGQNLIGVRCDDGTPYDAEDGPYWSLLLDVLEETSGEGIDVFAYMLSPHQTTISRWDFDWEAAAKELSLLSLEHPHLIGFTIDDFGGYLYSPNNPILDAMRQGSPEPGPFTSRYLDQIVQAARSGNPAFEFWPTIYYQNVGLFQGDGHVLGSDYGIQMLQAEFASVEYTFSLDNAPSTFDLSFLLFDANRQVASQWGNYDVRKRVSVNGNLVLDQHVMDEQYVELHAFDIAPHLVSGNGTENSVVFSLEVLSTKVNVYHNKLVQVWDVQLREDGLPFSDFVVTYDKYEADVDYTDDTGATVNNKFGHTIYAQSTEPFHIVDSVDGILCPYYPETTFYTADGYERMLTATTVGLKGKRLMHALYGQLWGKTIDYATLPEQIAGAGAIADAVVLWNHPNSAAFLHHQKGIYAERFSERDGYTLVAGYPGYQSGTSEWYQRWTTVDTLSGNYELQVFDSRDKDYVDGAGNAVHYFMKRVYLATSGTVIYEDSIRGDEGAETLPFTVATPEQLVVEFSEVDGVGNFPTRAWFDVLDSAGESLPRAEFVYTSGTTDPAVRGAYDALSGSTP